MRISLTAGLGLTILAGLLAVPVLAQQGVPSAAEVAQFRGDALPATAEDVTAPVAVRKVAPRYTAEAMRQKIQGVVEVEAVVDAEGRVDRARLLTSLDPYYGLDGEALRAVREWRFEPGLHAGTAVPVYLTLHLEFRLH